MSEREYLVENKECVTVGDTVYTPASLEGHFRTARKKAFDLPITAVPIVSESQKWRKPERLTPEQKEQLDRSPYQFDDSIGEVRFKTEFDYYQALLRAVRDNSDIVYQLKRRITAQYHIVRARYNELFDQCYEEYGKDIMGKSEAERKSWFHMRYPALYEIETMFHDFLVEIDIELDRWEQFSASTSRGLTAVESSYKATGRLFNQHSAQYVDA